MSFGRFRHLKTSVTTPFGLQTAPWTMLHRCGTSTEPIRTPAVVSLLTNNGLMRKESQLPLVQILEFITRLMHLEKQSVFLD